MKQKSTSTYRVPRVILTLFLCLGLITSSNAASPSTDAKILHVINRLSFGPGAGDIENVRSRGIEAYIQSQLNPSSIPQPPALTQQLNSLETLQLSSGEILKRIRESQQRIRQPGQKPDPEARKALQQQTGRIKQQAVEARLLRATTSSRQLEEVMVDFWYNHFNVDIAKSSSLAGTYEKEAIRPHVLGKFRQLLGATAKHPAMLTYLDNWRNTAPNSVGARGAFKGLNENYARELLELHTMGVEGGYSQQDVIALARILTGWGFTRPTSQQVGSRRVNSQIQGDFYFDTDRHDFSDKVFLGKTIKASGIVEGEQALDILASHPATARHISYKLAQYFVADQPPASLVDRLAKRFLETDGDLKAVLDTLFRSQEFLDPQYYDAKFKTPYQHVISVIRATDVKAKNVSNTLNQLGMPVYGCKTPNGYKNTEEAWLNPDSMLSRINFATTIGNQASSRQYRLEPQQVENRIGSIFSSKTKAVIESKPPNQRIALMLGSPEFMRR